MKPTRIGKPYTMSKRRTWKGSDHKWIRENWQTMTDKEMAAHFGVTENNMGQQRRAAGVNRPPNKSGLRKDTPQERNRAVKGKPFYIMDKGKRVLKIHDYRPDGTRELMSLARYVWMKANGPIPKGMVVIATNGDINDTRPENLECVTRAKAASIMQSKRTPELRRAVRKRQEETMRLRRKVRAYADHKPYPLAA